jgi:hypothetical protein
MTPTTEISSLNRPDTLIVVWLGIRAEANVLP